LRLGKATRLIAVRRPLPTRRNPTLPTRPVRPTPTLPTDRLNPTNPTLTSWTPRLGLTNGRPTRHLPIRPLMTLRLVKPSLSPTYPHFRHKKPFVLTAVTANTPSRQACSHLFAPPVGHRCSGLMTRLLPTPTHSLSL
jgi:hypothetical protein